MSKNIDEKKILEQSENKRTEKPEKAKESKKYSQSETQHSCKCKREAGVTLNKNDDIYYCNSCKKSVGSKWPHPITGFGPSIDYRG